MPSPFEPFSLQPLPEAVRAALVAMLEGEDLQLGASAAGGGGLGGDDDPASGTALVHAHALGCDSLLDASWRERSTGPGAGRPRGGAGRTSWRVQRTLLHLHRPGLSLPAFDLVPRRSLGHRLLAAASRVLGVPTLEIEGHPEFAARYAIFTANPASVRALLPAESLEALGTRATPASIGDLRIRVGPHGVLVHREIGGAWSDGRDRDERLDEEARRRLVEDALGACAPFANDPQAALRAIAAAPGGYAAEAADALESAGGLVGRAMRKRLVRRAMADAVRVQAPPRVEIPGPIAERAWRGTTMPIVVSGGLGVALLSMGVALLASAGGGGGGDERLVGGVFAAAGAAATVAAGVILRHRLARQRLVRRGDVARGVVVGIEATGATVNGDPIHRISILLAGEREPIVVKAGGDAARLARRMKERGTPTWVLQDPARPNRALWIEGWAGDAETGGVGRALDS